MKTFFDGHKVTNQDFDFHWNCFDDVDGRDVSKRDTHDLNSSLKKYRGVQLSLF